MEALRDQSPWLVTEALRDQSPWLVTEALRDPNTSHWTHIYYTLYIRLLKRNYFMYKLHKTYFMK